MNIVPLIDAVKSTIFLVPVPGSQICAEGTIDLYKTLVLLKPTLHGADSCSSFIFYGVFFNVITQLFLPKKEQMCKTGHVCLFSKVSILVKSLYYTYVVYISHPDMWW